MTNTLQENFDQVIPATIKEYVAKRTMDDVSAEVRLNCSILSQRTHR